MILPIRSASVFERPSRHSEGFTHATGSESSVWVDLPTIGERRTRADILVSVGAAVKVILNDAKRSAAALPGAMPLSVAMTAALNDPDQHDDKGQRPSSFRSVPAMS